MGRVPPDGLSLQLGMAMCVLPLGQQSCAGQVERGITEALSGCVLEKLGQQGTSNCRACLQSIGVETLTQVIPGWQSGQAEALPMACHRPVERTRALITARQRLAPMHRADACIAEGGQPAAMEMLDRCTAACPA